MPVQYVKPFVKTNKSDYIDAEANAEAADRPRTRSAPIYRDSTARTSFTLVMLSIAGSMALGLRRNVVSVVLAVRGIGSCRSFVRERSGVLTATERDESESRSDSENIHDRASSHLYGE